MIVIVGLVFVSVFAVVLLLLVGGGFGASQQAKQTIALLEATLATPSAKQRDQVVDVRKLELFSNIPWINRVLLQMEVAPRLRRVLYQADLKWTTGALILMSVACFVVPAYLIYLRTGTAIFSLLIGLLTGGGPIFYVLHKRKQRFGKFEQELPEVLGLIVSALQAGHSLVSALNLVAQEAPEPVGGEFRICYDEQNYGLDLRTAMENMTTRVPLQDLRIVVTAILIQRESGGNLAEVLENVAHVIRERFRLKRQVRVHTAQGRMTGWILSFLPVILGVCLYLINPKTMSVLWKTPVGLKLLYAASIMTVVGSLIIRKIVNMEV